MAVLRSDKTTYIQRLLDAREDAEEALRGIREFSHSLAVDKLLDCYFSVVRFDLEFKNAYSIEHNGVSTYQLMALHLMAVKKQFDIDDVLTTVNRKTVQSNVSMLKRLFTNNRAFGEVLSILNRATDLRSISKSPQEAASLPTGLSRFDMSVARGFDAIIGQDRAVVEVRALVGKATTVVEQPLSVLLYGPPGTGKTSIALAVGHEYKLNVYTVSVASLGGHYIGEREKNIVAIFDYLENHRNEDILLFVDEADSFLSVPGVGDSQQKLYTRAVTVGCFERYLRPAEKNNEGANTGTRILMLATNFVNSVAKEIRLRCAMIHIDRPDSFEDMYRIVDYYRKANRLNITTLRLERIARYCLALELAPSHVSQLTRRIATQVLLDMLKRGVTVRQKWQFGKHLGRSLSLLALPYFTVGGTAVTEPPTSRNTVVVKLFTGRRNQTEPSDHVVPLSGGAVEEGTELPAGAVYPYYDGDIEQFFRTFDGLDRLSAVMGAGDSTQDPEFVTQHCKGNGSPNTDGL